MIAPAPIAIFIFNRPDHLRQMLSSLLKCDGLEKCRIVVFADGPKLQEQVASVKETRRLAKEVLGDRAEYRFSKQNKGLAASIIGGVKDLLAEHGRVIVLEDDFELAPAFLTYMNEALERYCDNVEVYQISGHMLNTAGFANQDKALFLPLTTTWGWATWARAWQHFDPDAKGWEQLTLDSKLRKRFDFGGVYDYTSMLRKQMQGKRDSWGIRWYWSVFRREGLVLFPPHSLVRNTGMDGSGTHGGGSLRNFDRYKGAMRTRPIALPNEIAVRSEDIEAMRLAIWRQNGGWFGHIVDRIKVLRREISA